MEFKVLRRTAAGNIVLSSSEGKPIEKKAKLKLDGKTVAVIEETIASVNAPLYIARALENVGEGKILTTNEV